MDNFKVRQDPSNKITFKKVGNSLVAEKANEPTKKVFITSLDNKTFVVNFELGGALFSSTRARNLIESKELARQFLRGWENLPEFTGKGYKK